MKIDPTIRKELKRFLRKRLETLKQKVTIISASKMSDKNKVILLSHIAKNARDELRVEYIVDPSLLGGIMVMVGSKVINLSLKGQLAQIKQKLYANT